MSTRALFIQNGEQDGPGLFASALAERGVELSVTHAWRGEAVPSDPTAFAGIALGGGSMSAWETDQFPYLAHELQLIRAARLERVPLLGMCLGAQLMAGALGGEVFPNHAKEIGFFEVTFSPDAAADRLWHSIPQPFVPVHWHGDTFSLPREATLLASSALAANQLFRIDDLHYGVQFHLEIDLPLLSEMIATDGGGWLPANGVDPALLLADARRCLPAVAPVARTVFSRWADLLPTNKPAHHKHAPTTT